MTRERGIILAVWALALAAAVGIGLGVPRERQLTVLTITMLGLFLIAGATLVAATPPEGFIRRMTLASVGALAILVGASVVLAVLGAEGIVVHG